jgi:hypothetical protein
MTAQAPADNQKSKPFNLPGAAGASSDGAVLFTNYLSSNI